MIPNAVLLAASLVTSPVYISDVSAHREASHLRVEVEGSDGIDPDAARTKIDGGLLFLYLAGTRVHADNRAWELNDGAGTIRAHRHRVETELVVPLAQSGCQGPIELTATKTGLTALVGCDGPIAATAATSQRSRKTTRLEAAPAIARELKTPNAEPPPASAGAMGGQGGLETGKNAKLRALVALPDEGTAVNAGDKTADKAKPNQATDVSAVALAKGDRTAASSPAGVDDKASGRKAAEEEGGEAPVVAAKSATTFTPALDTRDAKAGAGLRQVATPALALMILAGFGYWLARRRRAIARERHIEILETATLGPKRSIVVARVGGETLVLGTSEAGITLLRTGAPGAAEAPSGAKATESATESAAADELPESHAIDVSIETDQPLTEALADIPEPTGAGPGGHPRAGLQAIEGGLASLFGRRKPVRPSLDDAMDGSDGDAGFGDVLEDSLEDQELRLKLAAGMSARVG
jgi:flagellar biogenesis protein FliO